MIKRLQELIDNSRDTPKVHKIFVDISNMPEYKQEAMLNLVEMIVL